MAGKNTRNARKKIFRKRETEIEVSKAGRGKEGAREDEERMKMIRIKSHKEYKEILREMRKEVDPMKTKVTAMSLRMDAGGNMVW